MNKRPAGRYNPEAWTFAHRARKRGYYHPRVTPNHNAFLASLEHAPFPLPDLNPRERRNATGTTVALLPPLLQAGLLIFDREGKRYCITDKGCAYLRTLREHGERVTETP